LARIRSVHPDLFLDEAFVSLSPAARLFLIGVWTESDDHGAFEWQPSRLRFKILPADGIAGDELLGELERANIIKKVDIDGRAYGLVRNFCRFQRPKKPTYKVDIPVEHRSFVALKADGSLPSHHHITGLTQEVGEDGNNATKVVTHRSPTKGEISAQEKEEGGREKEKESKINIESSERESPAKRSEAPPPTATDSLSKVSDQVLKVAPSGLKALGTQLPADWTPDNELCEQVAADFGMTDDDIRSELIGFHAQYAASGAYSVNWRASFVTWCKRWKDHRAKQAPPRVNLTKTAPAPTKQPEQFTEADWARVAGFYAKTGRWERGAGPDPYSPACLCPKDILQAAGIDPSTGQRTIPPKKAVSA
jgi:hypothetical protein